MIKKIYFLEILKQKRQANILPEVLIWSPYVFWIDLDWFWGELDLQV